MQLNRTIRNGSDFTKILSCRGRPMCLPEILYTSTNTNNPLKLGVQPAPHSITNKNPEINLLNCRDAKNLMSKICLLKSKLNPF